MKTNLFKPVFFGILLSITFLSFSNCNKLLDAFELNASFSEDVIIDISPNDDLSYSDELSIDLSTNEDFVNNADHVSQFTVKKISYVVTEYIGAEGILGSGITTFYNGASQIGDPIIQTDVNFGALYTSGASVDLPISQATIEGLTTVLKNTMKFKMITEGLVSDKPVYVVMEVTAEVNANVEP